MDKHFKFEKTNIQVSDEGGLDVINPYKKIKLGTIDQNCFISPLKRNISMIQSNLILWWT